MRVSSPRLEFIFSNTALRTKSLPAPVLEQCLRNENTVNCHIVTVGNKYILHFLGNHAICICCFSIYLKPNFIDTQMFYGVFIWMLRCLVNDNIQSLSGMARIPSFRNYHLFYPFIQKLPLFLFLASDEPKNVYFLLSCS